MMLDTGAFNTLLDASILKPYGLRGAEDAMKKAFDATGRTASVVVVRPKSLKIADFELLDYPIGTAKLAASPGQSSAEASFLGVLGPEVLANAGALIDCSSGRLYVRRAQVRAGPR
jgi:hypothetical protein